MPITVTLTSANDTYTSAAGDYSIKGGDGNDTITTGAGINSVESGKGNATITTGAGASTVFTGDGNQTVTTGAGNSSVSTGNGHSTITTGAGESHIIVGDGNNTITAGAGNATIKTGNGNDTITSGAGNDVIDTGIGNNTVVSAAGSDVLVYHVAGNQNTISTFDGGAGSDTLRLVLTRAEWMSDAVQADVANYQAFLAAHTAVSGEADAVAFKFSAFGLSATSIEKLQLQVDGVVIDPANHMSITNQAADAHGSVTESTVLTATGHLSASDAGSTAAQTWSVLGSAVGTYGTMAVNATTGVWTYAMDTAAHQLAVDKQYTETFSVRVTDTQGGSADQQVSVVVNGINNAPVVTSPTSLVFTDHVEYAAGLNPRSITSADVNGDGKADLIVANTGANNISVLLGRGDGTFAEQVQYATGNGSISVTSADINGDGKADLIVANVGSNNISVLLGQGDGTLAKQVQYATGYQPYSVISADVNGDGVADLITANVSSTGMSVLLGKKDGTFAKHVDYGSGWSAQSVISADVNGDHRVDLIVLGGSNSVSVLLGKGDGTFAPLVDYATGSQPNSVTSADVNGDGKADLIVVNSWSHSVSVLLGHGDGTFASQVQYAAGSSPIAVSSADFNGDGKADLIVASYTSGANFVSVLLGHGDGTFADHVEYAISGIPIATTTADVNGDGRADVITANYFGNSVSVLLSINAAGTGAVTKLSAMPDGSALGSTGAINFTDADSTDTHTVSAVTSQSSNLGTLTASVSTDSGHGTVGVVTWNYSVANSAVQYLMAGQTKQEIFSFDLLDGHGGSVTNTIVATITGDNDLPLESAELYEAYNDGGNSLLSTYGVWLAPDDGYGNNSDSTPHSVIRQFATTQSAGDYTFKFAAGDMVSIFVDGLAVFDSQDSQYMIESTADVHLAAGAHTLVFKVQNTNNAPAAFALEIDDAASHDVWDTRDHLDSQTLVGINMAQLVASHYLFA